MKFKTLFLLFLANIAYSQISFNFEKQRLANEFEKTVNWIETHAIYSNDGLILSDHSLNHYEKSIEIESIPSGVYQHLPNNAGFHTKLKFRNYFVVVNNGLDKIWVSISSDFLNANSVLMFNEVRDIEKWFLTGITTQNVTFNYGWLYHNSWLAESLIKASEVLNNIVYLNKAKTILYTILNYVNNEGRWLRYTLADPSPKYIAMSQAILMRALYNYAQIDQDAYIIEKLNWLAINYKHTTEGVWNHWSNSRIGGIIRDNVLGLNDINRSSFSSELSELYRQINQYNGKIPYIMNSGHPNFPGFKETYQTYDTYLLSLMSVYSNSDLSYDSMFPDTFREAVDVNYGPYFANNTRSVLNMFKVYGLKKNKFMNTQQASEFLSNVPTSVSNAIAKLQSIAALLEYGKLVNQDFTEKLNGFTFKLFHNYPNPFNTYTVISFLLFKPGIVWLKIFNTTGEIIKSINFGSLGKGVHSYHWDGKGGDGVPIASGTYIYQIKLNDKSASEKLQILR